MLDVLCETAMADPSLGILLRRLARAAASTGDAALSDAQLLERFVARRDEAAFELLVWRHGAMVLNLCRRLLRQEQDAEDAFQATFLVLARKARTIAKRQACASWLYKVAYRAALAARADSAARAARGGGDADQLPAADAADDLLWRDLRPVLDEEVSRLPEKYRAVFVLCCLEGRSGAEAAEQLRCPKGTVLSRLARARERLRRRLLRRGISLAVGSLAAVTAAQGQAGELTASVVTRTVKDALTAATVTSARAVALTDGVLRAMFISKLKVVLGIVLAVGAVGIVGSLIGNALLADPGQSGAPEPPVAEKPVAAAAQEPRPDEKQDEAMRRLQSRKKLEKIGVALLRYVDKYQSFPAPAIYQGHPDGLVPAAPVFNNLTAGGSGGPAGSGAAVPEPGTPENAKGPVIGPGAQALLSWRVAILPFLGEEKLYRQFKRNEPWDSEHNRKLLAKMPAVYLAPGSKATDRTYCQAIVGKEAAWEPRRQLLFPASIPDGTSNTIVVVEAASSVPWTKPEDLPYVSDQALPKFGGLFGGDFHALFADGAVKFLSARADEQQLRLAIMPADGNPIDFDKVLVHGAGGTTGAPADLQRENERLRAAIDVIRQKAADEKDAVERLRGKAAGTRPALDAKTRVLMETNLELKKTLDRALQEVETLRAERRRLEDELRKPPQNVKNYP